MHDLIGGIERDRGDPSWRSFYNITSWKDADAVYAGAYVSDDDDFSSGSGLADYDAMRGLPLWVDLDLNDNNGGDDGPNYKRRRGALDDDDREAVEMAITEYINEIADLYGAESDEIAAFDSGGGAYIYGPASATVPIADHYADDDGPFADARELIYNELRLRLYAYGTGEARNTSADDYGFNGVEPRVNDRVGKAEQLLNPDWIQNKNRQSKAPLSIHKNHDIVVSPLREADGVDYTPTAVSDVDEELIERTAREAAKIVSTDDPDRAADMADALIETLWPEYDTDGWRATLDAWLNDERARLRDRDHERANAERARRERFADRDDLDGDVDPSSAEALAGLGVTEIRQDVFDALNSRQIVDVRDVIRDHACDAWDTSARDHETTFDPSWRPSSSGKSCAVENGANTFVDSGVQAGGGPAKAYALGTGIIPGGKNAAARSLTGEQWGRALDGLRADGYEIPVYVPKAGSTDGSGEQCERTPLWALRKAAVTLNVLPRTHS
ncbi:hypothetical protein [Halalkalicoccus salilacus]|uniref:hypothetical protein n=1 Tax=Halalkalicoccus sp. GCM10025704 TaxID=3252662 RepID=UPI003616B4AF